MNNEISGFFDNYNLNNDKIDLNFLNGILATFQFINNKTDSAFDFFIQSYNKHSSFEESMTNIYKINDEIQYSIISIKEVKQILCLWLFSFLPINNKSIKQSFLSDKNDDFIVSASRERELFISEFVFYLIKIINPTNIYHTNYIQSKHRTGNDYDIICFESENNIFILECSWND